MHKVIENTFTILGIIKTVDLQLQRTNSIKHFHSAWTRSHAFSPLHINLILKQILNITLPQIFERYDWPAWHSSSVSRTQRMQHTFSLPMKCP